MYKKYAVGYWKDRDKEESDIEQTNVEAVKTALDTMRKYQQLQADYETRLRADMVAMLEEIQLECEENTVRWYVGRVDGKSDDVVLIDTLNEIIEQKINALKEN